MCQSLSAPLGPRSLALGPESQRPWGVGRNVIMSKCRATRNHNAHSFWGFFFVAVVVPSWNPILGVLLRGMGFLLGTPKGTSSARPKPRAMPATSPASPPSACSPRRDLLLVPLQSALSMPGAPTGAPATIYAAGFLWAPGCTSRTPRKPLPWVRRT